jgi:hypothetical protein
MGVRNVGYRKTTGKNKVDLKDRLTFALDAIKQNTKRIISFFHMPDTKYASGVA